MSEIFHAYHRGEVIKASDLPKVDSGLEVYGTIIHYEWRIEEATQQPDFWNEVYIKKVHPQETNPQVIHNNRPPDTREGRRKIGDNAIRIERPRDIDIV